MKNGINKFGVIEQLVALDSAKAHIVRECSTISLCTCLLKQILSARCSIVDITVNGIAHILISPWYTSSPYPCAPEVLIGKLPVLLTLNSDCFSGMHESSM